MLVLVPQAQREVAQLLLPQLQQHAALAAQVRRQVAHLRSRPAAGPFEGWGSRTGGAGREARAQFQVLLKLCSGLLAALPTCCPWPIRLHTCVLAQH